MVLRNYREMKAVEILQAQQQQTEQILTLINSGMPQFGPSKRVRKRKFRRSVDF